MKRCTTCNGTGKRLYSSTAAWRGGIGGQMITESICDRCWGSGDLDNPGEDLRKKERKIAKERRQA